MMGCSLKISNIIGRTIDVHTSECCPLQFLESIYYDY